MRVNSTDYPTLTNAAEAGDEVQIDGDVDGLGTSITSPSVADVAFRGRGSLANVYRKIVIPDSSSSDAYPYADLIPGKHLKQFNTAAKPVVVLVGDSISTYFANTIARSDMLVETLRDTLNTQMPHGVCFYDRSVAGMTLGSIFGSSLSGIPWAVTQGKAWIDYVRDLAPDLIIFSFGMNDGASCKIGDLVNAMAYVNAFPKVPSVVFCTNLVPSPCSTAFPEGEAGNEARDNAAGLTRSFAKFAGLGLLDFHRQACQVRDGFDPVSSVITRGDTIAAANNGAGAVVTGTKYCRDFKARITFTPTNLSASNYLVIFHGAGANDFVQVTRPTTNTLRFAFYSGKTDSRLMATQDIAYTASSGSYAGLVVEVSNDVFRAYTDLDPNLGQYVEPMVTQTIVRVGGQFRPSVNSNVQSVVSSVDFSYGEYRKNVPSVTNSLLFGDGSSAIDVHGGSGWNHPGGFAATHIYRPVVNGVNWCMPRVPSGSLAVSATGTSFTQQLSSPELTNDYGVIGSWEGSAAPAWAILSKSLTSFTITLAAPAGVPIKLNWKILRK